MSISEPYELDGVSISGTEISIVSGTSSLQNITTKGVYELWLDPAGAAMAKGDEFECKIYDKVISGGTKRVAFRQTMSDVIADNVVFPDLFLFNGWDMTLKKVAGTDRNWDASVRAATGSGITEAYTMSAVTVGGSEISIVSGTTSLQTITTDGKYQLWIDASNMAKADEYLIQLYETVEGTGGTKRRFFYQTLTDVRPTLYFTPAFTLINGWDMTIKKIAGTDRAFDASIRKAA